MNINKIYSHDLKMASGSEVITNDNKVNEKLQLAINTFTKYYQTWLGKNNFLKKMAAENDLCWLVYFPSR